jgi:putative membrane protein
VTEEVVGAAPQNPPPTDAQIAHAAAQTDLPSEWARLHPLSPIVHAGRAAVGLATIGGLNGLAQNRSPWDALIGVAIAAIGGVVYWRVTKWRIHGAELQIDTGLFRRQQVRVPLSRIQGIDLVRPLLARAVGVSELRLVLAGHDASRARLAYLSEDRALEIRAQLLALAHGLDERTPEPAERPILAVPGRRILAANLLSARVVGALLVIAAAITLFVLEPDAIGPGIGPAIALVAGILLAVGRQTSAEWEFQIAEAPDGLRLRSGLLLTRAETVPHGRVQAVRWVEPLWWRPWGWVRLEFDVARRRNADRSERQSGVSGRALLPAASREEARWLLSRVLPGAVAELPTTAGVPGRAFWRVPLARRYARVQYDGTYISCCTGRLRPDTVIVPLAKAQSIRWSQGPWSRRLGLGSIYIDTAGQRFTGWARFRDQSEAQALIAALPDLARTARQAQRATSR